MRFVFFCHSLLSDWNHGNAHFLRGVLSELHALGHDVRVYEPADGWSLTNLLIDHGTAPLKRFRAAYPELSSTYYDQTSLDLDAALADADIVVVHEWNSPELVKRIGEHREQRGNYSLFFHDTHHRSVTAPQEMHRYDLAHYDAVLAFGDVVRRIYLENGWAKRAFVWHEAADTRKFAPRSRQQFEGDLVWIGNFGDEERTAELDEFLLAPVRTLGLKARVYGVRYPDSARAALAASGIEFGGHLANFDAPEVYARFKITIHVPRRPYAQMLPGIPTIRPFEALACGIPLVSAPWSDAEGLFNPGQDFLVARDGVEMKHALLKLLSEPESASALAARGIATIRARHTCAHRVSELLQFHHLLHTTKARSLLRLDHLGADA